MTIVWSAILSFYSITYGTADAIYWLLLIPFAVQDLHDLAVKSKK
jgi:hypothetical protein